MSITRSGPPTTHDRVTWRVPLTAPPSIGWQQSFRAADESSSIAIPTRVQFEHAALTFRSSDEHVPIWIEYIDKWITRANAAEAATDEQLNRKTVQIEQRRDAQRQQASDANEKFKNL
jgi:hypothetical protein